MRRPGAVTVAIACALAAPAWVAATQLDLVDLGRIDARTGALLIAGGGRGTVDGAASWDLMAPQPGEAPAIRLVAEVSGTDLLRDSPAGSIPVAAAAYVLDGDGDLVTFLSRGVVLTPEQRDEVRRVGWRWIDHIELGAGEYSVRLLVRNHRTDAVFLDRFEVVVPGENDPAAGGHLMPPVAEVRQQGWVEVVGPGADPEGAPPARPVLVNGAETGLRVGMLGAASWEDLRIRLVDAAGRTVAEPRLTPAEGADPPYRAFVLGGFDVPVGLYRLVVRAPGGDQTTEETLAGLEILVAGAQTSAAWPVVDLRPGGDRDLTEAEEKVRSREIRRAYRQVLEAVARGDDLVARRELADLERRVAASESARSLGRLGDIQRAMADDLVRPDPRALRPVLWLHRSMNRYYRVRHESVLATHSWGMVSDLAALLAARGGDEGRAFAADVLAEQANELALVPAMRAAANMLRRTLQIDSQHVDALMALGASLERQGDTQGAADVFRRASRLEPGRHEATLRLAVNIDRNGWDSRALRLYRELYEGSGPVWIRTVAVQQLARGLVEDRKTDAAVAVLRRAVEELGPNPRLTIQLAHALHAARDTHQMAEVLDSLEADLDSGQSPRLRYAEWPELSPRVDHQRLAGLAAAACPALRTALGLASDEEG